MQNDSTAEVSPFASPNAYPTLFHHKFFTSLCDPAGKCLARIHGMNDSNGVLIEGKLVIEDPSESIWETVPGQRFPQVKKPRLVDAAIANAWIVAKSTEATLIYGGINTGTWV